VLAIEQAGGFRGFYFVLHGRLSPIDGIGPEQLGLDQLQARIQQVQPDELILATNPTVEGEATAHFISRMVAGEVAKVSRIAHGVPLGGEIEYTDGGTLTHALQGRRNVSLLD
jgi:recombination protein RecR